jgi:CheY-like chemotaxis protein
MALALPPDLILMDVMLPRMNGVVAARTLEADERTRQVPVVGSTGAVPGDLRLEGGGFETVLFEPYGLDGLLDTIRRFVDIPAGG